MEEQNEKGKNAFREGICLLWVCVFDSDNLSFGALYFVGDYTVRTGILPDSGYAETACGLAVLL